jgi:branched-chain amino acid transport system permease protein
MSYARLGSRVALLAALVAVGLLLPRFVSDFRLVQFSYVGIYFIAIFGLNILTGYNGQISLGHGAFMAVGGYTSAILIVHHGWNELATLPVAGLVAGAAGFLFGIPALRLSGPYLALATFALAVSMPSILKRWSSETGGSSGLLINVFHSNRWYYETTWICAGVLLVLGWLLLQTKLSRAWRAIRDSEVAAASVGVNLALYKTTAFGVSAAYAGVAGALLSILSFGANPGSYPIQLSIYLVVGLAVGGLGSLAGLLVGAAFVEYVQVYASSISTSPGVPTAVFGVALVLVMFVLPGGVAGLLPRLRHLWDNGLVRLGVVVVCALAIAAGATAAARLDRGGGPTSVKIGGTAPSTGVAAAYASVGRGAGAHDSSQTVRQTRKRVEHDGVFAIFDSLGRSTTSRRAAASTR